MNGPAEACAGPPGTRRSLVAAALAAAIAYAAAVAWVERPWFLEADAVPHATEPPGAMLDADLSLNVWILGWTAHAIVHAPRRLFDGNVFYPARDVLVGSENMLAHLPVTVPVLEATGNALHVLKAMALESFVASGVAMLLFVWWHTGDALAGFAAGAIYTFTDVRAHTIPQPQYLGTQYLPLALLAVDCWLAAGRRRALFALAGAMTMQALACVYMGYFAFLTVPAYVLVRSRPRSRSTWRGDVLRLALPFVAAAVLLLPVVLVYARAQRSSVIPVREFALLSTFSFQPAAWLSPGTRMAVGVMPFLVLPLDFVARWRRRTPLSAAERALWVLALVAMVLGMGPSLDLGILTVPLPYRIAYHLVPGFSAIRVPARFALVVSAAVAALTGFALARWTRARGRPLRSVVAFATVVGSLVHAAPRATAVVPARLGAALPPIYGWLARAPHEGGVVELPTGLAEDEIAGNLINAHYMMASTAHWQALLNGYTAYEPPTAPLLRALMRRLPDPGALQTLVDLVDVRAIIVHHDKLDARDARAWQGPLPPGMASVVRFDADEAYAVTRRPLHDWRAALLARAAGPLPPDTLGGVSRAPLPRACRAARILAVEPPPFVYPLPRREAIPVRFVNDSPCPWPGLDVRSDGLVVLRYHWISPTGKPLATQLFTRLVQDVPPGATVDDTMVFGPPGAELGRWTFIVELVQLGVGEPLATATATTELRALPGP